MWFWLKVDLNSQRLRFALTGEQKTPEIDFADMLKAAELGLIR
jgi:hypothetical protein